MKNTMKKAATLLACGLVWAFVGAAPVQIWNGDFKADGNGAYTTIVGTVATFGSGAVAVSFATWEEMIAHAERMMPEGGSLNEMLSYYQVSETFTAQVPDGYELVYGTVNGESSPRYCLQAVTTAAKYIVISPSSYVSNWKAYVESRKTSPVAAGITFAVKNADEIYAAYPVKAENTNGDPRNDAESIHKYIGMMQKLGTQYFVLGGRWVDVQNGVYDRSTLIPGVTVYPKAKKPTGFNLDTIASDLYYACHYKADGQSYVWDPNGDKIYVGLCEDSPDLMEDVRHFQPTCVVSRMNFFAGTYGGSEKTYSDLIAAYTTKLKRGEGNAFTGADRYMVWSSYCEKDVGDKPDCYPAQKARADYIPTVRAANEIYFSYLLNSQTVDQVNELRSTVLGQDWEVLVPVEHGTAEGLGNLQRDHIKASDKLIKFFMGNVPCMTGQVSANGCFSDVALSNPNGGTLVSINNTSYGYASVSGMARRFCGVSDELVDWCLDSYANGATAGEAWRSAIASFANTMLGENGFKEGTLEARQHDEGNYRLYVIAAMIEEMLFGDPLVKIQTEKGTSKLAVTVERSASVRSFRADDLALAEAEYAKDDAKSLTVTEGCEISTGIVVAANKSLAVEEGKTLTNTSEEGILVKTDASMAGAGTVAAKVTFEADAMILVSSATQHLTFSGDLTIAAEGIRVHVPYGTTIGKTTAEGVVVFEKTGLADGTKFKVSAVTFAASPARLMTLAEDDGPTYEIVMNDGKGYLVTVDPKPVPATKIAFRGDGGSVFTPGEGQTGWLTRWGGEQNGANKRMIGPAGTLVPMVFHDAGTPEESKWHPYQDITSKNEFTISAYLNLDHAAIQTAGRDYGVIWAFGNNTGAGVVLAIDAQKNLNALNMTAGEIADHPEKATILAENISSGYHLVTVTFGTTQGVVLTLDDGAEDGWSSANSNVTSAPGANKFQIGGVHGGTNNNLGNTYGIGIAEMLMFDGVLSASQISALAEDYPIVNAVKVSALALGSATVDASLMDLTVAGAVSGAGKLVVGGSIAGSGTITNLELTNGATLDASAGLLSATALRLPATLNVTVAVDADLTGKVELMTVGGLSDGDQPTTVSVTKKGDADALAGAYKLSAEDGKLYLAKDDSHSDVLVPVAALTTDKNAKVVSFTVNGSVVSPNAAGFYVVPYGATVRVKIEVADPDSYIGGPKDTKDIANVTTVAMVVEHEQIKDGYTEVRVPIVHWNSSEIYNGEMPDQVVGSGSEGQTYIRPGDTVIFGKYEVPTPVVIGPGAVGAQIWIQRDGVVFVAMDGNAILSGKTVVTDEEKTLTLDTATRAMILDDVTFDEGMVLVTGANGLKADALKGTSLISIATGSKIQSATDASPVNVFGRIGGGGTVDDNVSMKAGSRIVRAGDEYLTVTGFFSSHIALQNPDDEVQDSDDDYHRIMIDAHAATVTPDGEGYAPITLIQLANAEDAARMVKYIDIVAPEIRTAGGDLNQVPWELATDGSKIVLRVASFRPAEGFFTDGILTQDEVVDYPNNAVFTPNPGLTVDRIAVTGPAMINFTFAEGVDAMTVALPVSVDGGAIVFNVPDGKTVHVNAAITGTGGVVKTGAGTLVFGAPDGHVYDDSVEQESYWNTFKGALIIKGGLVRTDKKHGYGSKHRLADGPVDAPTIVIHTGATLDIGHTCANEYLTVFCAGTITNSVHYANHNDIGQIGELVLDGDSVMTGHTFGMARNSTINLKQHRLTISMDRTTAGDIVNPDGSLVFRDREFELDNTTIIGCRNNWEDSDIVVVQGTLSVEGSIYDADTDRVTLGMTDMHKGALKLCKNASLRLEAVLDVDKLVTEDANKGDIVLPCPTHGEHTIKRFWEESVKGTADTKHEDYGYIIIGHELHGGIKAPRVCFGRANDAADFTHWIYLDAGEYVEVVENLENQRQFSLQALDWNGDVGFRKAIHAPKDYVLRYIIDAFLGMEYPISKGCWWYPTGSSAAETVEYIPIRNDENWLYMYQSGKSISGITTINGKPIYKADKTLNEDTVAAEFKDVGAGEFVNQSDCSGVAQIDIVIEPKWMETYGYTEAKYGTYRAFLNEKGANGVERWQSYMLGLNPNDPKSLPVLSVRKEDGLSPSETKDGVTYLNVSAAGVSEVGYNFIEPVYQIQEVTVDAEGTLMPVESTLTPWQRSPNFQVPVPAVGAEGHVRYFRVNVSFQPVK